MDIIISAIKNNYPVSNTSIKELTAKFKIQKLPRKHILIRSDVIDRNYYFVEKGLARSYSLVDGVEATSWFSKEGDITFSMMSAYYGKPGYEFVELLEDSILYSISIEELEALYKTNIEIANWSRILHQKAFLDLELRHIALATQTAKTRYNNFVKLYPDLMNRVNLGYIASYLGVTQVTLSRLRSC